MHCLFASPETHFTSKEHDNMLGTGLESNEHDKYAKTTEEIHILLDKPIFYALQS